MGRKGGGGMTKKKTNSIRRDYKKVRRVSSTVILNRLNNISEERKAEIRNKMLDELNNEEDNERNSN